LKLKVKFEFLN